MATLAGIREQVRNNLYSEYPAEHPFTELAGTTYSAAATTITVGDGANYSVGDVVENIEDGELMYVTAITGNDLTVTRAYKGTTGNTINEGDRLAINPRITVQDVDQKVSDAVEDLSTHGVWLPTTTTITLDQTKWLYSVELGDIVDTPGILAVYYKDPSYEVPVAIPFKSYPLIHTDLAAAGEALQIDPGSYNGAATTGYVLYAKKYVSADELPSDIEEAVVLGATGGLIGRLAGPMLQDPGHLSNRTVPPGQPSRDSRYYNTQYLVMVRRIAASLAAKDWGIGTIQTNRANRWRR